MLSQIVQPFYLYCLENALVELLRFAERSPEMVEWDEVDKIFSLFLDFRLRNEDYHVFDKAGRILADLLRGVFTLSCYPKI